ncbi:MAG: hypothetical protein C0594_12435 [Marinilabiliales bacterium]|nr:MAG: hypothetical protein C0594_12435 [Marinilabiliales bacterium]
MKTTEIIKLAIENIPEGTTFGYSDLNIDKSNYVAAAKAIERLIVAKKIKKLSKGVFYKPEQSVFGELKPSDEELLKNYLYQDNKRIAYLTGTFLYNRMGLTTQVPAQFVIACNLKRIYINTQKIKAKPVKSYVDVTEENYELLGFLDALKDWKKIPDLDKTSGIGILLSYLTSMNKEQRDLLVTLALKYPPRVIAFLGALFEEKGFVDKISELKAKLNPLSTYNFGIKPVDLPTIKNWNIT